MTIGLVGLAAKTVAEDVRFAEDVLPILETHCIGCHTADDPEGGFVMESHAGLMKGGDSGTAITEGVPSSSRMLLMATKQLKPYMPPDGEEGPSEAELEVLTRWIEQGAKGPEGDLPMKRTLRTPKFKAASVASPITALARATEGQRMAKARFGAIEIVTGTETVRIKDSDLGKVNSISFSSDGMRLAAASGLTGSYGRAGIYDVETGTLLQELVGHRDILYAAEFSPDGSLLATAGYDRVIWLWDLQTGERVRELKGHNGAIFDLAFSPDGKVLVSACADETAKVWNVATGARLDTLSQPEGEVFAVAVTPDGAFVVAGSADNRLRAWRLVSRNEAKINPLVATRFVDETPIVGLTVSPDGESVVTMAESGNLTLVRTKDWSPVGTLEPLGASGTDLFFAEDGKSVMCSLMSGEILRRRLPTSSGDERMELATAAPIYMDLGEPMTLDEAKAREVSRSKPWAKQGDVVSIPRHVRIRGSIAAAGEVDLYRWPAHAGEVWAIDADASKGSRIDPIIRTKDWSPVGTLEPLGASGTDLF
ncbi:MAG: c-type cytochrome domain-containing protein, partial [Planctomycetota bacterium]